MNTVIPFEARRFQSSASHYLNGRPAYAAQAVRRVSEITGLHQLQRVLDLGTGPGQLAVAFAPYAREVVGVDPEPAMLNAARQYAAASGIRVSFVEGSSNDLSAIRGVFRLVTIGRAFHWMDRDKTLATLDSIIEPGGAVVLFSHSHPSVPGNVAHARFEQILAPYSVGYAAREVRRQPGWESHESILLASPFDRLEQISVFEKRLTPVVHFIDRAFSFSATSPERLGDRVPQLTEELFAGLEPFSEGGLIPEVVETTALIAWRA